MNNTTKEVIETNALQSIIKTNVFWNSELRRLVCCIGAIPEQVYHTNLGGSYEICVEQQGVVFMWDMINFWSNTEFLDKYKNEDLIPTNELLKMAIASTKTCNVNKEYENRHYHERASKLINKDYFVVNWALLLDTYTSNTKH